MNSKDRVLVALDVPTLDKAVALRDRLQGHVGGFKVGMQLCTAEGAPRVVEGVGNNGFLDLKYFDIPNTVAGAVEAAARLGVMMLNVHCMGGLEMMEAASRAARKVAAETGHKTLVIGVTILTSFTQQSLRRIGMEDMPIGNRVGQLAWQAWQAGLDGVVCSPQEIQVVREKVPFRNFLIVTPGIRKASDPADDQNRTLPAGEAVQLGADYIVVGRPITGQPDPVVAADAIVAEIDEALAAQA